jgi:hypothetical protein
MQDRLEVAVPLLYGHGSANQYRSEEYTMDSDVFVVVPLSTLAATRRLSCCTLSSQMLLLVAVCACFPCACAWRACASHRVVAACI